MWRQLEDQKRRFAQKFKDNKLPVDLLNYFHTQLIFVSSNFEDITLSMTDAKDIAEGILTTSGSRAVLQGIGQKNALDKIEEWAEKPQNLPKDLLTVLHAYILGQTSPDISGVYRTEIVKIRNSNFMTVFPFMINAEMSEFGQKINSFINNGIKKEKTAEDIVRFASWAHYETVRVHPFKDGNGRVARILMNLIFRYFHLPHVIMPKSGVNVEYRTNLQKANIGDLEPMHLFTAELLRSSLDESLNYRSAN